VIKKSSRWAAFFLLAAMLLSTI